jgi:CHAT domain-containing protein/TPR repeat protein
VRAVITDRATAVRRARAVICASLAAAAIGSSSVARSQSAPDDLRACAEAAAAWWNAKPGVAFSRIDAPVAIELCERAARADPSSGDTWAYLSRALARAERFDAALLAAERAAELVSNVGRWRLGGIYERGEGVPLDAVRAAEHYRVAADSGEPMAQLSLGQLYRDGTGVERNDVEAAAWLRRAAEQGQPNAALALGTAYGEGRGVARNLTERGHWHAVAIDRALAAARPDHALVADALNSFLWSNRGADTVEAYFRDAVDASSAAHGDASPEVAELLAIRAAYEMSGGNEVQAQELLQRAYDIYVQSPAHRVAVADVLGMMATNAARQSLYSESLEYHDRAIALYEQELGSSDPQTLSERDLRASRERDAAEYGPGSRSSKSPVAATLTVSIALLGVLALLVALMRRSSARWNAGKKGPPAETAAALASAPRPPAEGGRGDMPSPRAFATVQAGGIVVVAVGLMGFAGWQPAALLAVVPWAALHLCTLLEYPRRYRAVAYRVRRVLEATWWLQLPPMFVAVMALSGPYRPVFLWRVAIWASATVIVAHIILWASKYFLPLRLIGRLRPTNRLLVVVALVVIPTGLAGGLLWQYGVAGEWVRSLGVALQIEYDVRAAARTVQRKLREQPRCSTERIERSGDPECLSMEIDAADVMIAAGVFGAAEETLTAITGHLVPGTDDWDNAQLLRIAALTDGGRFRESDEASLRFLEEARTRADPVAACWALIVRADVLLDAGRPADSLEAAEECLGIAAGTQQRARLEAFALIRMSAAYLAMHRTVDAHRTMSAFFLSRTGVPPAFLADAYITLSRVATRLGDYPVAMDTAREALMLAPDLPPRLAYRTLGHVADTVAPFDPAFGRMLYDAVMRLHRSDVAGGCSECFANALVGKAKLFRSSISESASATARFDAIRSAKALLDEAIAIHSAADVAASSALSEALFFRGLLTRDSGGDGLSLSFSSGVTDTLPFLRRGVEIELEQLELGGLQPHLSAEVDQEARRARLLFLHAEVLYDGLTLFARYLEDQAPELRDELFRTLQIFHINSVSVAANALLTRVQADSADAAAFRHAQDLRAELAVARRASIAAGQPEPEQRRVRQRVAELKEEVAAFDGRLANASNGATRLGVPRIVGIEEARASLGDDEALIVYAATRSLSGESDAVFAVAVAHDGVTVHKASQPYDRVAEMVDRLRAALDPNSARGFSPDARVGDASAVFPSDVAYYLYEELVSGPLRAQPNVRHVFIVANGLISRVPFSVLLTARAPNLVTEQDFRDAPWLPNRIAVTVVPSVEYLVARRGAEVRRSPGSFLGVGDPALRGSTSAEPISVESITSRGVVAEADSVRQLEPLPDSADELRRLATLLSVQHVRDSTLLLGADATEAALKRLPLDEFRIIAFATHGLLGGELMSSLQEPALVLTPPQSSSATDDGLLTMNEVAALRLDADIVILSACNTASGTDAEASVALSGLGQAFMYAGARSLLVSQWAVESSAAVQLSTGTVERFSADGSIAVAEALRLTMVELIRSGPDPHPAYWAPFLAVGIGG